MAWSLTKKQLKLKNYIAGYVAGSGGIAPSFEEMTLEMGIKSKSGIHRLLVELERRQHIRRMKGRARAIEILDGPRN